MHITQGKPDDDDLLDGLFDAAFAAASEGLPFALDEWLAGREHLRAEASTWVALAREGAVQRPPALPVIPGYTLEGELGRGAMGTVYRARRNDGSIVALKVLPPALQLSPTARQRFRAEAAALRRLRHEHVVALHEVVETGDLCAFAMDPVPGRSVAQIVHALRQTTEPSLATVAGCLGVAALPDANLVSFWVRVGREIARALHAAHSAGLLHRDVKPANILVRNDGRAFLSDFGLARDADWSQHTTTGAVLGTPAYAAPEQLRGEPDVDVRADVYGLGAALYESFTRHRPFAAENPSALLRLVEAGRLRSPRQYESSVPRDLEAVLMSAMAPEREQRYATAAAFADDLDRIVRLQPVHARLPSLQLRAHRLLRRHRMAIVPMLVTAVVVLAAVGLVWRQVAERAAMPARIAAHVRQARLALLIPETGSDLWLAGTGDRQSLRPNDSKAALVTAAAEYAAARSLGTLPGAAEQESRVVDFAQALLLDLELPDVAGELSRNYAAEWRRWRAAGSLGTFAADLSSAPTTQRRGLGLLAYLCQDPATAVRAWRGLDLGADPDPLIDAASGLSLLAEEQPAHAWPRLLTATIMFPEAGCLVTALADAALRCGDTAAATRYLERARSLGLHDRAASLERVDGDLLLARGELEAAARVFERVRSAANPLGRSRLIEVRRRQQRWADAVALLLEPGSFKTAEARALDDCLCGWWDSRSTPQRIRAVCDILSGAELSGVSLLRHLLVRLDSVAEQFSRRWRTRLVLVRWAASDGRSLVHHLTHRRTTMLPSPRLVPVLCAGVLALSTSATSQWTWTPMSPTTSPTPRFDCATAWNSHTQRCVLFGGHLTLTGSQSSNETWEWDGTAWAQIPAGSAAPELASTSMVYDSARMRMVLFGGRTPNPVSYTDQTWEFDGSSWTRRFPATTPPHRVWPGLVYDSARSRVVMFGGRQSPGVLADMWEWDGTDWFQLQPPVRPSPRLGALMSFDPVRQRVVLFGGQGSSAPLFDTWEWDGTSWTEANPMTVPQPEDATLSYDPMRVRSRLVGSTATTTGLVWEWDGTNWHAACGIVNLLPRRHQSALVHDVARGRTVAFGGWDPTTNLIVAETNELAAPTPAGTSTFGTGCAGSAGVPTLRALTPPIVGLTFQARLTNIAPGAAIFCIGWSNTQWNAWPLPLPLGLAGLHPSCTGYTSVDLTVWTFQGGGIADYTLGIPCNPGYYGAVLYLQGASIDPALTSAVPIAVSNGVQIVVGG